MDEQENMDPSIIGGLFEQGVRPECISKNSLSVGLYLSS